MNVRKFKGSRALALFIALTMVMMYSVTFTSFATIGSVRVHYPAGGDYMLVVESVYNGTTYTAICGPKQGDHYDGSFNQIIESPNDYKLLNLNTTIKIQGTTNYLLLNDTQSSAGGNDSFNIHISGPAIPPPQSTYDLEIIKVVDDSEVTVGSIVTFLISADNIGNSTMTGVTVTDNIPSGLSISAFSASSGTNFDGDSIWTVGQLGPSEMKYLTISAVTTTAGAISNTATGAGNETETSLTNNTSTVRVTVKPDLTYDLGITKTVDDSEVGVEDRVVYTVILTNNGNTSVSGVTADDTLPIDFIFDSIETSPGTSYDRESRWIEWTIGTMMAGESKTLTISGFTTTVGTITNDVAINSDRDQDQNTGNDTASAIVNVSPEMDLGIIKTAYPTSMLIGASVDFVVMITNHGTMEAYDIDVTDIWPTGVSLSGVAVEDGTTIAGMVWSIESLEPAESKTLTLSAVTTATGTFENVVEIMDADWWQEEATDNGFNVAQVEGYHDANMLNNTDSAIITVSTPNNDRPTTRTTRTTPVVIVEPEIPLAEEPVVTPIILEEPTPLADVVPQTSDSGNIWLLLGLMLGSGLGITTLGRRKETTGK